MDGFEPRRATSADVGQVRTLSRIAYAKWVELIDREPLPMTADYSAAVKKHLIDLWEENGQVIALIEMINATDHLLIQNIAVHPDQQGRGCGGILLKHAEDVARGFGYAELRLFTNAAFASNIEFYSRRGYKETKREIMVPGSITVHMTKWLSPRSPRS